jgi:hypothetical protein
MTEERPGMTEERLGMTEKHKSQSFGRVVRDRDDHPPLTPAALAAYGDVMFAKFTGKRTATTTAIAGRPLVRAW